MREDAKEWRGKGVLEFERIAVEIEGSVGRILLRHGQQNVIDFLMMEELAKAFREIEADASISVVLLKGRGENFSAGVDIPSHTPDKVEPMLEKFHTVIRLMAESSKVLVAEVRGNCLGGGAELVLLCDIVHTSSDARWGFPEIKLACFPPVACAVLSACVGQKRAAEMVLTGETFTGAQAVEYGLANSCVEAKATVEKLAKLSGSSLKSAKRALYSWYAVHFDKALAHAEKIYREELVPSKDMAEGIRTWMEKHRSGR
jgi:cyclohexa-1,5-dienecarbonyl-CoA hydratase